MADTPTTTPPNGAELLNSLINVDQLAFRKSLDALFAALRADWIVHEHRSSMDTEEGRERSHQAALAWAESIYALHAVLDLEKAHNDLKTAANAWLKLANAPTPETLEILECRSLMLKLYKKHKNFRPTFAALFFEASSLAEVYSANIALMSMHRAAN